MNRRAICVSPSGLTAQVIDSKYTKYPLILKKKEKKAFYILIKHISNCYSSYSTTTFNMTYITPEEHYSHHYFLYSFSSTSIWEERLRGVKEMGKEHMNNAQASKNHRITTKPIGKKSSTPS